MRERYMKLILLAPISAFSLFSAQLSLAQVRVPASPLMNLKYRWYTTKIDELEINANATVEYDFN
jgi:hypothetical protein